MFSESYEGKIEISRVFKEIWGVRRENLLEKYPGPDGFNLGFYLLGNSNYIIM
jgi:hypothetical protein